MSAPTAATPARPGIERRVLFFGDSFVAGYGDPQGRGWVGRVVEAAWAAGIAVTAYNLGVRRETSSQVVSRWAAEAPPRLAAGADCRLVVSLGANDTTHEGGGPREAPERAPANLERIIDAADGLGVPAFVVGPPPVGDPEQDDRIEALARALAAVCSRRGVGFADVTASLRASRPWTTEAAAGDGSHPGAGGYARLAALVLAAGWLDWLAGRPAGGERSP